MTSPRPSFDSIRRHMLHISSLLRSNRLSEARRYFDSLLPHSRHVITWNSLLSAYVSSAHLSHARKLFDIMPHGDRDAVSWNALISGLFGAGEVERALELFGKMPVRVRDRASLTAVVCGLLKNGRVREAERVLMGEEMKEIKGAVDAYNALIAYYGRNGMVGKARMVFDSIPCGEWEEGKGVSERFERNLVSWNSMIMCYSKVGDFNSAQKVFDEMPARDLISWNTIISCYVHALEMEKAEVLFNKMPNKDLFSYNLMIYGFTQKGDLERALCLFHKMTCKNTITWNTMISGYERNREYEKAIELFSKMQFENGKPDKHTFSSVLSASANLAMLNLGTQIHQVITKSFSPDTSINNALITMYSKCRMLQDAHKVFDEMKCQRDVISYNAMLAGFAYHGLAREALELFEEMKRRKTKPTYITFISLLNACGQKGLINEGKEVFHSMIHEFGIEPRLEHWSAWFLTGHIQIDK